MDFIYEPERIIIKNEENKNLFKEIYGKEGTVHPVVASEFTTIFETPDKERGSIISTATQKMKIFMDPLIRKQILWIQEHRCI